MLNLVKSSLKIGVEKPIKLLHVTDTHISDTDERDDERKRCICQNFDSEYIKKNFRDTIDYCNANCDMMVHSGDLITVTSPRSLEVVREYLDTCNNYTLITGNHEYSQYCGEAWEDTTYKMNYYPQVRHYLKEDLLFTAKEVGGINIVGIDDSYYQVEPWQLWRLQREIQKGLPIVLLMHVPLFEESLFEETMQRHADGIAYLTGCDEEHLLRFKNEFREVQQRPTESTLRFIDYVYSEPLIKCVLTGHLHFNFESILPNGIPQYVTSLNLKGDARELTLY